MNSFTNDGVTYSVGANIIVLSGHDKGRIGKIEKFYPVDGIVSVSVKYDKNEYSMYQISDVELI
jgi:ribosomal protein L24